MGPAVGSGRDLPRRTGRAMLASLLAVELVALVGSRLFVGLGEPSGTMALVAAAAQPAVVAAPRPPARAETPAPAPAAEPTASAASLPSPPEPPPAPVPLIAPEPPVPPAPTPQPIPEPEPTPTPTPTPAGPGITPAPRNLLIRDDDGRARVARLYHQGERPIVLLPDGRLGWPSGLTFCDDPFQVEPADDLAARLTHGSGPFGGFATYRTAHYTVLYEGSRRFAEASGNLLESLYDGLLGKLAAKGLEVRDAEFPLVAVIYRDEERFRATSEMPPDVLAYYHVLSNRIYLYETSEQAQAAPDVAARKRPQTVAHEGTHQILMNVGVHPRLAHWPPWVVEGLAEYFAPTLTTRDGDWGGANRINPFHLATIRDLNDPLAIQLQQRGLMPPRLGRDPDTPLVEYLVTRAELTPTDYALAWALTYYLANKRFDDLVAYLKDLGRRAPLEPSPPERELAEFRRHFGDDLAKLDRAFQKYLASLRHVEPIPFYAVTFEQPIGRVVRRSAMISQSPASIRQWVEAMTSADGAPPVWHAVPFPTRTRARLAAEQWMGVR